MACDQLFFQGQIDRDFDLLRHPRNLRDLGTIDRDDDTRAIRKTLDLGQNRNHGLALHVDHQVESLGRRHRETVASDRFDFISVYGQHGCFGFAQIDPEGARCCSIDQAQPDPAIGLSPDDLRIIKCAIIGQKCVIGDVVKVHGHHPMVHAAHHHAFTHGHATA
ncbi:hypothetical protein D3C87_1689810 [compost metagenome]